MPKALKTIGYIFLCLVGVAACLAVLGPGLSWTFRGLTDFMGLYAGAKLSFTGGQYDISRVLTTEVESSGYFSPTRLFMLPPCFGLLLWPLAQLPYAIASRIWEFVCVSAVVVFAISWPEKRKAVVLACCWSLPLWMTLAEGQDTALLLVCITLGVLALRKERPLIAGLLLSLCAAKFQLFLLLPVWIIVNKLWRVAWGLTMGAVACVALSFVAGGMTWPQRYYDFVTDPANHPYADIMPNLHSLCATWPHRSLAELGGAAAVAVLVWFACRQVNIMAGLATILMGGIVVAPHDYMADCVLLLPAMLILLSKPQSAFINGPALFLFTPLPYIALMTSSWVVILPLVVILIAVATGQASAILRSETDAEPAIRPQSEQYLEDAVDSPA